MRKSLWTIQQQSQVSQWLVTLMKTTFLVLQLHLKESTSVIPQVLITNRIHYCPSRTLCILSHTLLDHEVQLRTTRAFLLELRRHVFESDSLIAPYLHHINAHLHNAVLACRAAQAMLSTESPSFSNKQHIPSGTKNEH